MFKRLSKESVAASVFLAASALPVVALDENRLWLPSNYERSYLDLKASAEAAEKLDRCAHVLRGTIDLQNSLPEKPVFRIQCRQPNGRTYNELVDGVTKETLTTPVIKEKVLTADELDALRVEEENKRLAMIAERKMMFLKACKSEFDKKTMLFIQKTMLKPEPEPEEFENDQAKFYLDFDAVDVNNISLAYRAICMVDSENGAKIVIRKRR